MALGYNRFLRIISPRAGQKVKQNTILKIRWEKASYFVAVDIYYRLSPNLNWIYINRVATINEYNWLVPTTIFSQQAQIKIVGVADEQALTEYYTISDPFIIYKGNLVDLPYPYIIHGYGKPVIEIYQSGALQYEILLNKALSMTETFTPEIIVHKLFNGQRKYIAKGWWYSAELDFSDYTQGEVIASLQPLFDFSSKYLTENRQILFYPRGNIFEYGGNINYFYKVEIDEESEFIMQQLQHYSGYRGFKLRLKGIERLSRPFEEITYLQTQEMVKTLPYGLESGYGENYGDNYGENL